MPLKDELEKGKEWAISAGKVQQHPLSQSEDSSIIEEVLKDPLVHIVSTDLSKPAVLDGEHNGSVRDLKEFMVQVPKENI